MEPKLKAMTKTVLMMPTMVKNGWGVVANTRLIAVFPELVHNGKKC